MDSKDKRIYFVPNIPGTSWEKAARLIEMAKDEYNKALATLESMQDQICYGIVHLGLAEDHLNSHQMQFDEMLVQRLRTSGLPADEANQIYEKIAPKRIVDSNGKKDEK